MKKSVILLIFLIFFVTLSLGLFIDTKDVNSPLDGKHIPSFYQEELKTGNLVNSQYFPKNAFLINVWASWCLECTREHMLLKDIQKQGIDIIGINYKDKKKPILTDFLNPKKIPLLNGEDNLLASSLEPVELDLVKPKVKVYLNILFQQSFVVLGLVYNLNSYQI